MSFIPISGLGLLGHVLERAAGKPFDRLLQEMVCEPLQLERTAIQVNDKLRVATGYGSRIPRRARKPFLSGEICSFRRADHIGCGSGTIPGGSNEAGSFLQRNTRAASYAGKAVGRLDGGHGVGMVRRSSVSDGRIRIVEKNGGRNNCSAWIGFAPDYGVGVVVLTNCGEPGVDPIGEWLLERSIPGGHKPVTKDGYAKVAPYTGVRWENDRPVVRVRGQWSRLVSIDGLPVEGIMEFAQKEFGDKARKRFAEDLVELLSKMGHDPQWEVALGLEKKDGQVEQLKIRMTKENRDVIRN